MGPLRFAVPKGRILEQLAPLLARAGVDPSPLSANDRRLVRPTPDGSIELILLKPDDVPTYVEYGAADVGATGRDTLLEGKHDVYAPVDLGIGRCKLVLAGKADDPIPDVPRVATKFPRVAQEHFERRGLPVEVIPVHGSVELAPLVGLAHLIVDLVETGTTLRDNGLVVRDIVAEISTVLVVNRAAYKLRADVLVPLCNRLRDVAGVDPRHP